MEWLLLVNENIYYNFFIPILPILNMINKNLDDTIKKRKLNFNL